MKLVIVGGGHGAAQCITSLRMAKFDGAVTLITDEGLIPYQRPPLSKAYLMDEITADRLPIVRETAYEKQGIDVRLNTRVTAINRAEKSITLQDETRVAYDKLILATGGRARRLPLPGADLKGIASVRTIQDIDAIKADLDAIKHVTIVGGGYIGLEAASALIKLGKAVTVLEAADRVLARVVAPEVSTFYEQLHKGEGVDIRTSVGIDGYEGTDGSISAVTLKDGSRIETDLVIEGVGMIPNDELAKDAGLDTSEKGIVIDAQCCTSDPDIFAIGDVTDHENLFVGKRLRLESVQNAVDQAKVAVTNALDGDATYNAIPWFWSEQFGLKLQIAGVASDYDRVVTLGSPDDRKVTFLYMAGDQLQAADCIANTGDFMAAKKVIEQKKPLPADALTGAESLKEAVANLGD